jgi:hypothetical protein
MKRLFLRYTGRVNSRIPVTLATSTLPKGDQKIGYMCSIVLTYPGSLSGRMPLRNLNFEKLETSRIIERKNKVAKS